MQLYKNIVVLGGRVQALPQHSVMLGGIVQMGSCLGEPLLVITGSDHLLEHECIPLDV